ncbi:MAG: hypothetical protein KJ663_01430 [Proteobacteria bacterium]|nr:hypothetical protein [Pseudomonadota bacterium]
MIRLGIRYCGGCNPAYDRIKLVEQIREKLQVALGEEVSLALPGAQADTTLVVCGCPACCADGEGVNKSAGSCHIVGPDLMDYRSVTMEEIPVRIADELAVELKNKPSDGC